LPIPDNEESLAIPRTKVDAKSFKGGSEGKSHKREGEKKKHKKLVSIKDDYIRSLHEAIDNLKALNDQQKKHHEAEIQGLRNNREACAVQAQNDAKEGTLCT